MSRFYTLLLLLLAATAGAAYKGELKADTAATIKFCLVDATAALPDTTHDVDQADIRLTKNGGNFAQKNDATNNAAHDELGCYDVAIDETDTNTEGRLEACMYEAGILRQCDSYSVVKAAYYDLRYDPAIALLSAWLAGSPSSTTIASVTSPSVVVLSAGYANDNGYAIGSTVAFQGGTEGCEQTVRVWDGATKTLTLDAACPDMTLEAGDAVVFRHGASGPLAELINALTEVIDGKADSVLNDTAEIGTAADTDLATDIANAAAAASSAHGTAATAHGTAATAHGTAQADLDIITGAAGVVLDSTAVADIWDYNIDDGDGDDTMSAACAIAIALAYAGNDWAASDSPAIGGVDTLRTTYRDPSDGEDRLVVDRSATSASRTLIAWTCPDGATGP